MGLANAGNASVMLDGLGRPAIAGPPTKLASRQELRVEYCAQDT